MSSVASLLLSVVMLAAGGLLWGGIVAVRRGPKPLNGWLMIVMALVLVGNVLVLTM